MKFSKMIRINYKSTDLGNKYFEEISKYQITIDTGEQNLKPEKSDFFSAIRKKVKNCKLTIKEIYDLLEIKNKLDYDFEILITSSFTELLKIKENIEKKNICKNDKKIISELFKYDGYIQKQYISPFFEKYVNPVTCYYCNIDFVNVFFSQYKEKIDFINNAPINELKLIDTDKYIISDEIDKQRSKAYINEIKEINKINEINITKLDNLKLEEINIQNGFTLDHVIDKGEHPYFALSFYNLVPSCYVCNSKLKGSKNIGEISPTDISFNFHNDVKFRTNRNNQNLIIKKKEDFELDFKINDKEKYREYINVFHLKERYNFHKTNVIEFIDKKSRYSDSQIQELADFIKQNPQQLKEDIFGKFIFDKDFDLSKRPLAKLTRDIAEELGLI